MEVEVTLAKREHWLTNESEMVRKTRLIFSLAAALSSTLVLSSCKSDESKAAGGSSADESSKAGGETKKYGFKDMMKISREISDYKDEIGYKSPAEADRLESESTALFDQFQKLKKDHPTLKGIEQEGAEAKTKLAQAVIDKDDAAKQKWGPIAAQSSAKRIAALAEIPEIMDLEKKLETMSAKIDQLEYDELSKTPKGKELADKSKEIVDSISGK